MRRLWLAFSLLAIPLATGQESPNHVISESSLNSGGGIPMESTSHQISLDGLAPAASTGEEASPSFALTAGFVAGLIPAGEVARLRFVDPVTLAWDVEPSLGDYSVYRGLLTQPFDSAYGSCLITDILDETATDSSLPDPGSPHFYLVTARNSLLEEGTKGAASDGTDRPNPSPCS